MKNDIQLRSHKRICAWFYQSIVCIIKPYAVSTTHKGEFCICVVLAIIPNNYTDLYM